MSKRGRRLGTLSPGDHTILSNRRRFRRYGIKVPCQIRPWESPSGAKLPELQVETENVSGGGIFFVASAEWPVGTPIELDLDFSPRVAGAPVKIKCQGRIARVVQLEEGRLGIGATIERYRISHILKPPPRSGRTNRKSHRRTLEDKS
jgi:hypothetical protein